jgi:hypothetical protein
MSFNAKSNQMKSQTDELQKLSIDVKDRLKRNHTVAISEQL